MFLFLKYSNILIARFAPSKGSVPEPNSSTKIKLSEVALFTIFEMFFMWLENVLKESAILWSSPISAKISSNTYMLDFSSAGIFNPLQAIASNRPTVFKLTVLPPVFGPVIISKE